MLPTPAWRVLLAGLVAATALAALASVRPPGGVLAGGRGAVVRVSTRQREVALTFDDGPDPTMTTRIVAELSAAGAHATFFMLGYLAERYPGVVRRITGAGDEIANHGLIHVNLAKLGVAQVLRQVDQAESILRRLSGQRVVLFRFPYLSSTPQIRAAVAGSGLTIVGASIDPRDWTNPGVERIVQRATAGVRSGDIILLHDGGGRPQTTLAVPAIISRLQADGFHLVTVSQLLADASPVA